MSPSPWSAFTHGGERRKSGIKTNDKLACSVRANDTRRFGLPPLHILHVRCQFCVIRAVWSILANRPDLVGTVPIWRPKPDVPPDDPKKPIRPDLSRSTPKNTVLNPFLPVLFVLQSEIKFLRCLLAFFHVPVRCRQLSKQKICIIWGIQVVHSPVIFLWAQETVYIFRPIFSCSKCVESLTKTLKYAYLTVSIFKIFRGSMPPDPLEKRGLCPRNDRFAITVV